jgi:endonuclease I
MRSTPALQNAPVNLGLVLLDADWAIDGSVFWFWDAAADKLSASKAMNDNGDEIHRITVSAGTANAARSRPDFDMWTDAQQKQRHPGDEGLSRAPTGEAQKRWPM